jgi:hypothetical protein
VPEIRRQASAVIRQRADRDGATVAEPKQTGEHLIGRVDSIVQDRTGDRSRGGPRQLNPGTSELAVRGPFTL